MYYMEIVFADYRSQEKSEGNECIICESYYIKDGVFYMINVTKINNKEQKLGMLLYTMKSIFGVGIDRIDSK